MARNNYQSDKRQREMRKKLKKEEKAQRKADRDSGDTTEAGGDAAENSSAGDAPAASEGTPT